MKMRIVLVLAVLMLAAPVWAEVLITCTQVGDTNEITVSYDATGEPNFVRAFALDITTDNGVVITNVTGFDPNFEIYPGSIVIVGGTVTDYGTPIADKDDYAVGSAAYNGTEDGLGSTGVTIEMGSLNDVNVMSGVLCSVFVDCTTNFHLSVEQNAVRGGVVLEDPEVSFDYNSPGADVVCGTGECFPDDADYATQKVEWDLYVANGWDANCWCDYDAVDRPNNGYQCHGDAALNQEFPPFWYRVYTGDLSLVVTNWKKTMKTEAAGGANPCADVDHKKEFPPFWYRVYTGDLGRVVGNWKKTCAQLCQNCPLTDTENNAWTSGQYPVGCP